MTDLDALKGFAREIIAFAFEGRDADGGSIQALAIHYGLLNPTRYDPAKHGNSFDAEPGDEWFEFTGTISTPSPALRSGGDRE
jgi:hypothetical protein